MMTKPTPAIASPICWLGLEPHWGVSFEAKRSPTTLWLQVLTDIRPCWLSARSIPAFIRARFWLRIRWMEILWTRTPARSSWSSLRTSAQPGRYGIWFRLSGRKCLELHAQLFHFFVVILAVEDVPLLRALQNRPLLALDLLAGRNVDLCLLHEQGFENLAGFLADGVGIFDELDFVHLLEHVGHGPGQHVHFIAA